MSEPRFEEGDIVTIAEEFREIFLKDPQVTLAQWDCIEPCRIEEVFPEERCATLIYTDDNQDEQELTIALDALVLAPLQPRRLN